MKTETNAMEALQQAARIIRRKRPAYGSLVDYYARVFAAQEKSRTSLKIAGVRLDPNLLSIKKTNHFPLMDPSEFPIDKSSAEILLADICRMAAKLDEAIAASAAKILQALEADRLDVGDLIDRFLTNDSARLARHAEQMELDRNILALLIYHSVRPSIAVIAESLGEHLDPPGTWEKGYCPVCGNLPVLSSLRQTGERYLICGFCWHQWRSKRFFCPFCERSDQKEMHYLYIEEEKEYRVDLCRKCARYIKTIDNRKMDRPLYPPLEQIGTLHLDMKAEEAGYTNPTSVMLP